MEPVRAAATVSWTDAIDFAANAFAATGVPPTDARRAAEALVDADLHGTVTHGMKNLRELRQPAARRTHQPAAEYARRRRRRRGARDQRR